MVLLFHLRRSDMEKKLKYPELEQGNYEAQTEAVIKQSKDLADAQEKRAKRDRDMAIFGDIASLVSKGAAMHGGAWKINKEEPMAAKGNEKLRALQESNSKQLVEYAKMRMNAADADRKERNAQKVAEYNAGVEQHKRDVEAQKYANEQAYKARKELREIAESEAKVKRDKAYADFYNNGGRRTGSGSSVNRDVFLVNDDGTRINFTHADDANNVQAAYARLPEEYKVKKEVKLYDRDALGNPVLRIDEDGAPVTTLIENTHPTLQDMRFAISEYNARELRGAGIQWDDEDDDNNEIDEDFS